MTGVQEVKVVPVPLQRLATLLPPERVERIEQYAAEARRMLGGRTVWNINSTARGGGVAEMLHTLVAYAAGTGIDVRWLVVGGDPDFFAVTKRIHNRLHGVAGDSGALDAAARASYDATLARHVDEVVHLYGMAVAYTMVQALKGMKSPTRDGLMESVRNMQFRSPILLPGVEVQTSKTDGYPIESMQIQQFNGQNWQLQGDLVDAQR